MGDNNILVGCLLSHQVGEMRVKERNNENFQHSQELGKVFEVHHRWHHLRVHGAADELHFIASSVHSSRRVPHRIMSETQGEDFWVNRHVNIGWCTTFNDMCSFQVIIIMYKDDFLILGVSFEDCQAKTRFLLLNWFPYESRF